MSQTPPSVPPRRRWWRWLVPRFSLRTMLIVTTLVCVVLGTWITCAERQRAAVRAFFDSGGNHYGHAKWNTSDGKEPWWLAQFPEFLREGRAKHYWTSVEYIGVSEKDLPRQLDAARQFHAIKRIKFTLATPNVPPETWPAIAAISTVRRLEFFNVVINDQNIGELSKIPNLRELRLWGCEGVTDVGVEKLADSRGLEVLEIELCPITNRSLEAIGKVESLRELKIHSATINDDGLPALYGLPRLQVIDLEHTSVAPDGVAKLQEKLPRCKIIAPKPKPTRATSS